MTEFAHGFDLVGGNVKGAPSDVTQKSAEEKRITSLASSCSGSNGNGIYWWGNQIRLDSCNTQLLISMIAAGAGTAALAGAIASWTGAGGAAGAIVAAILTIGAAGLSACASYGNGIYLNQLWTGTPFCWGQ